MKRLWLEWDGAKATGIWEGRIWDVELEESFTRSTFWGVNLKAGDEILRLIAGDWDPDHGNNPLWIDCYRVWGIDDFNKAVSESESIGQAAVDFFRNEIRENGIMRHIFALEPVEAAIEPRELQLTPDMPRHQVDLTLTLGDSAQELQGHIAEMPMPAREQLVQGIRRMQEEAMAAALVSAQPRIIMDMEVR